MKMDLTAGIACLLNSTINWIINEQNRETDPYKLPFKVKYAFDKNVAILKPIVEKYNQNCMIAYATCGTLDEEKHDVILADDKAKATYTSMLQTYTSEPVELDFYKIPKLEFENLSKKGLFSSPEEMNIFHVYMVDDPEFLEIVQKEMAEPGSVLETDLVPASLINA